MLYYMYTYMIHVLNLQTRDHVDFQTALTRAYLFKAFYITGRHGGRCPGMPRNHQALMNIGWTSIFKCIYTLCDIFGYVWTIKLIQTWYIYIYIHIYNIHIYICIHVYMYNMHTCIYVYLYICMCIYIYIIS